MISVYNIGERISLEQRLSSDVTEFTPAWIPDLIGPIFKSDKISLREILNAHQKDRCTRTMATFVPDELIYAIDLIKENYRQFNAVVLLIDITGLAALYEAYSNAENGGSYAFNRLLDNYVKIIMEKTYTSEGDVLQLSTESLLAMWKIHRDEFTYKTVHGVIECALRMQELIAAIEGSRNIMSKVKIIISVGTISFAIIGNEKSRHFVVGGQPIVELKDAKKVCLPGDVVLTKSAWDHCTANNYEYVIKNSKHVKIMKALISPETLPDQTPRISMVPMTSEPSEIGIISAQSLTFPTAYKSTDQVISSAANDELDFSRKIFAGRVSMTEATRRKLGDPLKNYILKPVVQQIENDAPVEFLTEMRRVTVISLDIVPNKCSTHELIDLVDKCFTLVYSTIENQGGCIYTVNLFEKNIYFLIVFGIEGYALNEGHFKQNECKNGIICAMTIHCDSKNISGIQNVYIGVSTGIVFCGVVGHPARRQYVIIGPPVDRSIKLMQISLDKVSCDYDTVFYSHLSRNSFHFRGIKELPNIGKRHVFEFLETTKVIETFGDGAATLNFSYPTLGLLQEIDEFGEILDEIGMSSRVYAGILIESPERFGKSRLLDTLTIIAKYRDLQVVTLSLHESFFDKNYSTVYHITLILLGADDCKTIEERERILLDKLGTELKRSDLCYLNIMMRVRFPFSKEYCAQDSKSRQTKAMKIFNLILQLTKRQICIILDDVHYMDVMSWQFLAHAMENVNVVLAMTIIQPDLWDDLTTIEIDIRKHPKVMKISLTDHDTQLLSAYACQFLNVVAIPEELSLTFEKSSGGSVAWCESFLILALQWKVFDFVTIFLSEVKNYRLVFPAASLITKVPADFLPEDVAPPKPWTKLSELDICLVNQKYADLVGTNRNLEELRNEIYNTMSLYQQTFMKCASVLGVVFTRTMLQSILPNHATQHTSRTVSEMIRTRLLQCASIQRKSFRSEDLMFCMFKKRYTFSDSHHLLQCSCRLSRVLASRLLPPYAHCKMLEFRIPSFRKMIYGKLSDAEKKSYHEAAAYIYNHYAHKCRACGGGPFILLPCKEVPSKQVHFKRSFVKKTPPQAKVTQSWSSAPQHKNRRSIYVPNVLDTPTLNSVYKTTSGEASTAASSGSSYGKGISRQKMKLLNRASVAPSSPVDASPFKLLSHFSFVDYRNCQCSRILSCVFWSLSNHIAHVGDNDKILQFLIEYCAGLIQNAQPSFAMKIVTTYKELITDFWTKPIDGSISFHQKVIRTLIGDAHMELGNLSEAQEVYVKPKFSANGLPKTKRGICYSTMIEELRQGFERGFPLCSTHAKINESNESLVEVVSYSRRFIEVLIMRKRWKPAKLIALKSLRIIFESTDNFIEKAEVYLTTTRLFRLIGELKTAERFGKSMLLAIQTKNNWRMAEELFLLAESYLAIYHIRALRGDLEGAIEIGHKVLKISTGLHISRITLTILPSFIEIMMWTKRINEAVDLLKKLYFLADEDTDMSTITWYYALSLELLLDGGLILESYESCLEYALKIIVCKRKACVSRDPSSLTRLLTCLWVWQLRMGFLVNELFIQSAKNYTKDVTYDQFSNIFTCVKALECYLLILLRCINMKKSVDLDDVIHDVHQIMDSLKSVSNAALFVKPQLHLLKSYFDIIRGRQSHAKFNLHIALKCSTYQGNKLMIAWIRQNKRTWKVAYFNNMAQYWVEHVGFSDAVNWQDVHGFDLNSWSTILYPFPIPDKCL